MISVLNELATLHKFRLVQDESYWPSKVDLNSTLMNLPKDAIYVNHCGYLPGLPKAEYVWINVMRDPIELEESYYYYKVSDKRGEWGAIERRRALEDRTCGCSKKEFDDCYRLYITKGVCEDRMRFNHSALRNFHDATNDPWQNERVGGFLTHRLDDGFTGAVAFKRVMKEYAFVGLTDEMELTLKALEKLLPRFFANATAIYQSLFHTGTHANRTPERNRITHTEKTGAVSTLVREALKHYNPEDMIFYENVKRLFWLKIASLFPDMDHLTVRRH